MEKKKPKKSKEEIAREFDLPERKSKIATIMKQDGEVYCICRTSDCSRFMIGCDGCEEWYHGDCINVTEKEAKHIKHYYCQTCRSEDPSLSTVFRVQPIEKIASTNNNTSNGEKSDAERKPKKESKETNSGKHTKRCGACEGCRTPNCGVCNSCRIRIGHKPRCERRQCISQEQTQNPQTTNAVVSTTVPIKHRRKLKPIKERTRKRRRSLSPDVFINPELEGIRQCYGPGCVMHARSQSKYCSDQCGINLATNRIFQVLPQRVQEWNLSSCRAEEENRKQLDQIRNKQAMVKLALTELDKRHLELDMIVERAKHSTIDPNLAENNDIEDEQSMYCITCGHEIHSRTAIKHMEKCFNKYESQASFGSIFKTRIEGNSMFCDFYNPASKTYCKRLRVLCPEHCKDPKVHDSDVCGCPLVANVFYPTGEFCRAPKKSCFKHYVWEKIRRAEIDLERVRQWLKMDELLEQERQIRHNMASRAGVLGLMLHSTYNHELMEEIVRQQQQMAAAQAAQMAQQKEQELLQEQAQHKVDKDPYSTDQETEKQKNMEPQTQSTNEQQK